MPRYRLVESMYWHAFDGEHRCSRPWCHTPAVLVGESMIGGTAWHAVTLHVRHRYLCARHANDYSLVEYRGRWWYRLSGEWPLRPRPRKETHANVTQ